MDKTEAVSSRQGEVITRLRDTQANIAAELDVEVMGCITVQNTLSPGGGRYVGNAHDAGKKPQFWGIYRQVLDEGDLPGDFHYVCIADFYDFDAAVRYAHSIAGNGDVIVY